MTDKPEFYAQGEKIHTSRLKAADVLWIRQNWETPADTKLFADKFDVSTMTIRNVLNRKSWASVK